MCRYANVQMGKCAKEKGGYNCTIANLIFLPFGRFAVFNKYAKPSNPSGVESE